MLMTCSHRRRRVRRLRAKLGPEYDSMVDTVRGVGYMAVTPPQPQWVVAEPTLTPVWTSLKADLPAPSTTRGDR
jgi:hypothetical protein